MSRESRYEIIIRCREENDGAGFLRKGAEATVTDMTLEEFIRRRSREHAIDVLEDALRNLRRAR